MSLFPKLIASATALGSSAAILRDFRAEFLLEEERPLYQFVYQHIQRYGMLPSEATLRTGGFTLPTFSESPIYYNDRLRQRYAYNLINERHPAFREALERRDMELAVSTLRSMVSDVGGVVNRETATTLVQESAAVIENYQQRKFRSGLAGVTFGWSSLDAMTLGAMGSDMIVYAGRPSMGKSWCLFESAYQAWRAGHSICIVSMEMSKAQVVRRWIGRHLGINPNFIRAGQISSWTEHALVNYGNTASQMPRVSLISGEMDKNVDIVEETMRENLPDAAYIDAMYLMSPAGQAKGYVAKWEQVTKVMGQLKKLSINLDRPISNTVQFNRNQKSDSRKPMDLGDIGGSDAIPQDASIVLGVRAGLPPYEKVRRRLTVMKNREGVDGEFTTDFTFTPPSMVEINPEQEMREDSEWMV